MNLLKKSFAFAGIAALMCCCSDDSSTSASNEISNSAYRDTLFVYDTLKTIDTLVKFDTVFSIDTVTQTKKITKIDTVIKIDTVKTVEHKRDTITKTNVKTDTLSDTIYVMQPISDSTIDSMYAKFKGMLDSTIEIKHDTIKTIESKTDTVYMMQPISDSTLDTMYAKIKDIVDTALENKTVTDTVVQSEDHHYLEAINKLSWTGKTVYTIGHLKPDADAVFSAIAYAALMDSLGYNVEPRMTDVANNLVGFIAEKWNIELPEVLTDATNKELILVDHNEYRQAVAGAEDARIMQIIDHHNIGSVTEINLAFSMIMPVGSTCTIVYTLFKELGVTIDEKMAKILIAGIITDTKNLTKKATTTKMDEEALKALLEIAKLQEDINDVYKEIESADKNYDGMTPFEIFTSDPKEYDAKFGCGETEKIAFTIGSIEWFESKTSTKEQNTTAFDEFSKDILSAMQEYAEKSDSKFIFSKLDKKIVDETSEDGFSKEGTYILYYGTGSKIIATTAFGESQATAEFLTTNDIDGENYKSDIYYEISESGKEGGIIKTNSSLNRKVIVAPLIKANINASCSVQ